LALTQVVPKRTGRPVAEKGTVRILKSGVARLSPDLCLWKQFTVGVDKNKKQIVFKEVTDLGSAKGHMYVMWYSSKAAKSGLISVISALRELNMDGIEGCYTAKKVRNSIVVDLSKKLGC